VVVVMVVVMVVCGGEGRARPEWTQDPQYYDGWDAELENAWRTDHHGKNKIVTTSMFVKEASKDRLLQHTIATKLRGRLNIRRTTMSCSKGLSPCCTKLQCECNANLARVLGTCGEGKPHARSM
jgi:hypothetical protein